MYLVCSVDISSILDEFPKPPEVSYLDCVIDFAAKGARARGITTWASLVRSLQSSLVTSNYASEWQWKWSHCIAEGND